MSVSKYECLCNTNANIISPQKFFKWLIWNGRDYLKLYYSSVLVTYSNWSQIRSRHWRIQRSMLYGYQIKLCIIWFIAIGKVHWLWIVGSRLVSTTLHFMGLIYKSKSTSNCLLNINPVRKIWLQFYRIHNYIFPQSLYKSAT